jgi:prolyl-tRNA synthetase
MIITDIAAACAGDPCPECGTSMRMERGVEVGNIFQLGTRYSDTLGCTFLDRQGKPSSIYMGSYGIGLGRLLACVAEACHDEDGLIWPVSIAPFQVHLILLPSRDSSIITEKASSLYSRLLENNIEVLFDDRDESPGVKFKDADLIGCPLRLTVSERTLAQGSVELKIRSQPGKILVPMDEVMARIDSLLAELRSDLLTRVVPVKYNG